MDNIVDVGVIGGGVSGVVVGLQLAVQGINSVLFEKEVSVVSGPPFCHLHAGGNLYPDISEEQCRILMKQSIDMAKLFPQSIDERPTFISIPKTEKYEFTEIKERLEMLVSYYKQLIEEDRSNEILGSPEDYYKIYTKEDLDVLVHKPSIAIPGSPDQWMTNAIQLIDYDKLKTPVILVQEYGWNLFRLGAQAQLALKNSEKCDLKLNTKVSDIRDLRDLDLPYNWEIHTEEKVYKVKYLVNSCGFKTGKIDESLHLKAERLIEFKAAYVSKWQPIPGLIPELIFHGERGTPHGMAQLTPYCEDYYQIHGMTEDITLFKDGLVKSKGEKVQPEFESSITEKLTKGWQGAEARERTDKSIAFIANFVPSFETAIVGGPPLFGAQQIPGNDASLRVGEVRFPTKSYARSEIVKASSALTVADQIIEKLEEEGICTFSKKRVRKNILLDSVLTHDIDKLAAELAVQRGYPEALSRLVIQKK